MTTVPPIDEEVGMLAYATKTPPHVARLRSSEEEFQVEEVIDGSLISKEASGSAPLPLYLVRKRGIDTPHMARLLGDSLKSRVSFAGLKDRRAVTTQYVSPTSTRSGRPARVVGERFTAELVGYVPRPVTRGMMRGNRFRINMTEADAGTDAAVEEAAELFGGRRLPNFFGYQRFGLRGMRTHRVGRAVVMGRFEEAVRLMVCEPRAGEGGRSEEARRLAREGRYAEAERYFSSGQDVERGVVRRLASRRDDYLGALRSVPMVVRRLLINSYQSYIFNRSLSAALLRGLDISRAVSGDNWTDVGGDGLSLGKIGGAREEPSADSIPLIQIVGYAFRDYGSRFDAAIKGVLEQEGVSPAQFYIKEAQEMSSEGTFRSAPLIGTDFRAEFGDGSVRLAFSLARGEYATVVVREVLKPEDPLLSGF